MVMVGRKGGDDPGPQSMRLRVRQFERSRFFEVVVQEPGVVDEALQDQRLAAGDGAALAAEQGARRELRTCRLIGGAQRSAGALWTAAGSIKSASYICVVPAIAR